MYVPLVTFKRKYQYKPLSLFIRPRAPVRAFISRPCILLFHGKRTCVTIILQFSEQKDGRALK